MAFPHRKSLYIIIRLFLMKQETITEIRSGEFFWNAMTIKTQACQSLRGKLRFMPMTEVSADTATSTRSDDVETRYNYPCTGVPFYQCRRKDHEETVLHASFCNDHHNAARSNSCGNQRGISHPGIERALLYQSRLRKQGPPGHELPRRESAIPSADRS